MFTKSGQRGFTLIELLVVIAIIGILAATVLASLGSARNSGQDAKVKQQLASLRAQAELTYTSEGDYDSACTNAGSVALLTGLAGQNCDTAATPSGAWAAEASLPGAGGFWCVDSTGTSHAIAATKVNATVCPAS